jgi:hypothetical protein
MHVTAIEPALFVARRPFTVDFVHPMHEMANEPASDNRFLAFGGRYGHPMHAASLGAPRTAHGSFNEPTSGWSAPERPNGSSSEPSDDWRGIQPSLGSFSEPISGRTNAHWSLGSFNGPGAVEGLRR